MAKLYAKAIMAGTKKYSEVTAYYKPQVKRLLEEKYVAGEITLESLNKFLAE